MSLINPSLYFRYLFLLYLKNFLAILLGISTAFAMIDYFGHIQKLEVSLNYKILYIFYMWEEALGLLYPLALIFAVIMTKMTLIKSSNMGALHAFGYSKRRLFTPIFVVTLLIYILFIFLHTTSFSYAKDKAQYLLKNQIDVYNVTDLFFKYNDHFVYIKRLDPVKKRIEDMTIFKVQNHQVHYTMHTPVAFFNGHAWEAEDAVIKRHIYFNAQLIRYDVEQRKHIVTLEGYKPNIIESLYEGKALNIIDAFHTWQLLDTQGLDSSKVRATLYSKVIQPLFALALVLILFYKLPFHARMMNMGVVIALSLGTAFMVWGLLFGLGQMGVNGVLAPEIATIVPIGILVLYALYLYLSEERLFR